MVTAGLSARTAIRLALADIGVIAHDIPLHRTGLSFFRDAQTFHNLVYLMPRIRSGCVMGYTIKPVVYGPIAA